MHDNININKDCELDKAFIELRMRHQQKSLSRAWA